MVNGIYKNIEQSRGEPMDLKLLTCFTAVSDELHFGRAARKLDILPSALGRNIRLLEEELGVRLFQRSTRNVSLTASGHVLLREARVLLAQADSALSRVRAAAQSRERVFRLGAIDSAATGLVPPLVHDFREQSPDVELVLVEDKSARLLPKLLSGTLDLAIIRPPSTPRPAIETAFLLDEPTVVALPASHPLAARERLRIEDLADLPLIVPSPRDRPHSHNLTLRLFLQAGLTPRIVQQAGEKQTIVNLVSTGIGAALVPHWTSRIAVEGVVYRPLVDANGKIVRELPLAAAWVRGSKDNVRDELLHLLASRLDVYADGLTRD
ncbi:MAG: hypothetical protein RLZ98_2687 [Pseudomonadota bacterium]|jgi:DNA-binding transcriptional LysR family regulator